MTHPLLNNRYQILETLGRGGFGETFLAVDTHMPSARRCVIKLLKPVIEGPEIPQWLQDRFQREAATLEELGENHSQIPRLYAYFSEGGNFYLVQEWIEGATLTQLQEKQGNFSSEQVERLLLDLLPVLKFIHQRRIIHRDIKPDNIIVRAADNKPILIDFGVIKEAMGTLVNPEGKSAYSVALGTPGYMASEQAAGRPVFSSDLYSLGLTAIFLLAGKTPQYLETDARTGEIIWRAFAPQAAPALAAVIDKCIRFHPRDRYPSAKEALIALTRLNTPVTPPTQVVRPVPLPERSTVYPSSKSQLTEAEPESETSPWITWFALPLLFGAVILGGISAGFFFASKRRAPAPTPTPPVLETPSPDLTPIPALSPSPVFTPRPRPTPTPDAVPVPTPQPEPVPEVSPDPPPLSSPEPTLEPEPLASPSPLASPPPPSPLASPSPLSSPPLPSPLASPALPDDLPSPAVSPPAPPLLKKSAE
ncbi:MAG: serine/threonine-protein kinase [Cyanobacteriota bacterium]|nr:serine/threonine-protein kinase [Cyanobacteriota bacterium]